MNSTLGFGMARLPAWFAVLVPLWLLGLIFPPTLDSEEKELIQFVSLCWILVVAVVFSRERFLYSPIQRQDRSVRLWTALFLAAITISAVNSSNALTSLNYVGITVIGLVICSGLWSCIRGKMRLCLCIYAFLGSALTTYVYFTGSMYQGRLSLSVVSHPNHLALIAFGILVSALAVPNVLASGVLVGVNMLVIIATQARGSLVASVIAILTYLILLHVHLYKRKSIILFIFVAALTAATCMIYESEIQQVLSGLLFLNDRYRGMGTGFTGRTDAWQEAYQLFLDNPIFGIGFRMHEQYMTTLSSAHNGYLSMLAETGISGVICAGALTVTCIVRLFRLFRSGDANAIAGISLVFGYLFLAVFERYFINVGNPTSVLVWLFLFMPARKTPVSNSFAATAGV